MKQLYENVYFRHLLTVIFSAGLVSFGVASGAVRCESKAEVEAIVKQVLPSLMIDVPSTNR